MKCEDCVYYLKGDDNTGLCKRYPPVLVTHCNENPEFNCDQPTVSKSN